MKDGCRSWAPAEIFVGGASPKKAPSMEKKVSKRPPKMRKKRPPYEEKVAKRPPI